MEYEIRTTDNELTHWGIKGMRWGIRRYQNKDGSLTAAGKKKLREETAKVRKEEETLKNRKSVKAKIDRLEARKKAVAEGKKELDDDEAAKKGKDKKGSEEAAKPVKKSIADMTDDELASAINRARLEQAYAQLHPEPAKVEKHPMMKKMVDEVVKPAMTNAGKKLAENALNNLVSKITEGKADPNSIEALTKVKNKLQAKADIISLQNQIKRSTSDPNGDLAAKDQKVLWDLDNSKRNQAADEARAARDAEAAARTAKVKSQREAQARATSNSAVNQFVNRTTQQPSSRPAVKNLLGDAIVISDKTYSTPSSIPKSTVDSGRDRANSIINSGRYDRAAIASLDDED